MGTKARRNVLSLAADFDGDGVVGIGDFRHCSSTGAPVGGTLAYQLHEAIVVECGSRSANDGTQLASASSDFTVSTRSLIAAQISAVWDAATTTARIDSTSTTLARPIDTVGARACSEDRHHPSGSTSSSVAARSRTRRSGTAGGCHSTAICTSSSTWRAPTPSPRPTRINGTVLRTTSCYSTAISSGERHPAGTITVAAVRRPWTCSVPATAGSWRWTSSRSSAPIRSSGCPGSNRF